jgi:hypothetical protein
LVCDSIPHVYTAFFVERRQDSALSLAPRPDRKKAADLRKESRLEHFEIDQFLVIWAVPSFSPLSFSGFMSVSALGQVNSF